MVDLVVCIFSVVMCVTIIKCSEFISNDMYMPPGKVKLYQILRILPIAIICNTGEYINNQKAISMLHLWVQNNCNTFISLNSFTEHIHIKFETQFQGPTTQEDIIKNAEVYYL